MPKVILPNPMTDGSEEIRVTFKAILPPEWAGMDADEIAEMFEDEETDIEIHINRVEALVDGDFEDVSEDWMFDPSVVDELEEEVRVLYVDHKRESYVDRMYR